MSCILMMQNNAIHQDDIIPTSQLVNLYSVWEQTIISRLLLHTKKLPKNARTN